MATVTGVLPPSLPAAGTSQTIMVAGSNFKPGLTVDFTQSNGDSTTLGGSAIRDLTDTSFQLAVMVSEAGTYSLRVTNPSSPPCNPVTVTAQPTTTTRPAVAGLSPASPARNDTAQTVIVAGNNFAAGLSVALTAPSGATTTLGGSTIQNLTGTLFQLAATLAEAGSYSLRVTNPSGQTSEPWTFTVKSVDPPARPTVTGLSPSSPTQNSTEQPVYVAGTNFESGLTATLTLPNGTTSTVSGSAIPYISATTFKMTVVLAAAGNYSLRVTNPSGQVSEPWSFTVKAGS